MASKSYRIEEKNLVHITLTPGYFSNDIIEFAGVEKRANDWI